MDASRFILKFEIFGSRRDKFSGKAARAFVIAGAAQCANSLSVAHATNV